MSKRGSVYFAMVITIMSVAGSESTQLDTIYTVHRETTISESGISNQSTRSLDCASSCLSAQSSCLGFSFNKTSGTCDLHHKICFAENGTDDFFVRTDHSVNTTINKLLAQNKPASASSGYPTGCCPPSIANDGVYNLVDGTHYHSKREANPYWRVDLQNEFCVRAVYFMNRGFHHADFVWQRTKNIVITVSLQEADVMDTGTNRCGYIDGVAERFHNTVTCTRPMIGQFVQLQMLATEYLHLYEVEVHGY